MPDRDAIAFTLDGNNLEGETWQQAVVLINPTDKELEFALPEGKFDVYVSGDTASAEAFGTATGTKKVPARTLAVLARGH